MSMNAKCCKTISTQWKTCLEFQQGKTHKAICIAAEACKRQTIISEHKSPAAWLICSQVNRKNGELRPLFLCSLSGLGGWWAKAIHMFTSNLVWEGDRHRPFIICSQVIWLRGMES